MQDKPNTGVLFKRDKASENTPDYSGPFTGPDGEEMEIAAWIKTSRKGTKYMSVKVSEKYRRPDEDRREPAQPVADLDDEIPF